MTAGVTTSKSLTSVPQASICQGCGAADFPPRLRCYRCGSQLFAQQPVLTALVAGVTRVHRVPQGCPYDHLVELHADGGLRLLAAACFAPRVGSTVQPTACDDGAIVLASPTLPVEGTDHV